MAKNIKEQLAAGAAEIRKAQAAKKKEQTGAKATKAKKEKAPAATSSGGTTDGTVTVLPPIKIEVSTRDIKDIIAERVVLTHDSTAAQLVKGTPIEEYIRLFDYFAGLNEHTGFLVGDIILGGQAEYGERYDAAMAATGRSYHTLRNFVRVAKAITPDMRRPRLTWSTNVEVARLTNPKDRAKVLSDAEKAATKGKPLSTIDVRKVVAEIEPPKPKSQKKSKAKKNGKGKKGTGKVEPPYEPTADEEAALDAFNDALTLLSEQASDEGIKKLVIKIANDRKRKLTELLAPIVKLANNIESHTGY